MRGKKSMRNRMIRTKTVSLMAGLVAAVSLAGCGLFTKSYDFTEAENSIYVQDNATIRAAMISDFDKDYYSIDELAGVAQQEALSFNTNVYGCKYYSYDQMTKEEKDSILLPVCYESASVKDKKASVVFTYANGDTYTGFNSAEIQSAGGSKLYTSQLGSSTMTLSGEFVTSDGQKSISADELMKKTDYCLVYADYPVTVFGEHDIAYVSPNVTVLASNCAKITGNDGGYIIFK